MKNKCPTCKSPIDPSARFCEVCGTDIVHAEEKTKVRKSKSPKQKREKSPRKTLNIVIALLCVLATVVLVWFAVGNYITLSIHTNDDLDILNSGSLKVPGAHYSKYSELPDYVAQMLGKDDKDSEYGPLMSEVIPYIRVERNKINGLFGQSSVEYTVYAPDLESWLLNQNPSSGYTQNDFLKDLKEYIPSAQLRPQKVTIEYSRVGLFDWEGDYMSLEFSNAVSGGINTAYNKLYEQISDELEENLK